MGGLLGGGSSINFMMYTRAQGVDFDSWNTDGWRAEDMIPLCNKLETYHPKGEGIDQSKHGHVSPQTVHFVGCPAIADFKFLRMVLSTSVMVVSEARARMNSPKQVRGPCSWILLFQIGVGDCKPFALSNFFLHVLTMH
jgi:choline dehydrogenase-like flavoprotein